MNTTDDSAAAIKVGPIHLKPGITKTNFNTLIYAAIATNCMMSFINLMQPIILEEILHVPADQQGTVSGNLTFISELVALSLLGIFGALSDRTGRRPIVVLGFIMLGVGYALYPFMPSVNTLYASRALFAIGVAAVSGMMATILNDYPTEQSRGKMMAVGGVASGAGGILMMVLAQLPEVLEKLGRSTVEAIQFTLLILFVTCLLTSLLLKFGLNNSVRSSEKDSEPLLVRLKIGLRSAAKPRIAVSYASAFVARSDFVVVGTFFILWFVQSAREAGMDTAEATAQAGLVFAVMQLAALISAPFIGVLIDRIDRLNALAICMGIVAVSYTSLGLITDPLSPIIWPLAAGVGVGMMSGFLASQALVGEAAPERFRGSIIGFFGLSGAIGILCVSSLGGYIYDNIVRSGPFLLTGLMATTLVVLALVIRRREIDRLPDVHTN